MRLALIQMSCTGNQQQNIEKAVHQISQAADLGANLVCLQELFNAHYPCQSEDHDRFDWAEEIPGPTSRAMSDAAKKFGVVVTGSVFERRAQGLYHNTALVYDRDGSQVGFYRKMHIPDDPLYYEKFYFTPGDTGSPLPRHRWERLVWESVGTNGIQRPLGYSHCEVPKSCFIRQQSVGCPRTKPNSEQANIKLGKR